MTTVDGALPSLDEQIAFILMHADRVLTDAQQKAICVQLKSEHGVELKESKGGVNIDLGALRATPGVIESIYRRTQARLAELDTPAA